MRKSVIVGIDIDPQNKDCCKSIYYAHSMSTFVGIKPDILCKHGGSQYCNLFKKNLRSNDFKVFRCRDCKESEKGS